MLSVFLHTLLYIYIYINIFCRDKEYFVLQIAINFFPRYKLFGVSRIKILHVVQNVDYAMFLFSARSKILHLRKKLDGICKKTILCHDKIIGKKSKQKMFRTKWFRFDFVPSDSTKLALNKVGTVYKPQIHILVHSMHAHFLNSFT